MIGDAEETENENPTNDALETQSDVVQGGISFHAISGTILPQTLRLPGRIQNKDVVVLVDGGRETRMHGASAKPISRCTGVCYLHRFLRTSGGGLPDGVGCPVAKNPGTYRI
uniref:Uncharacterized protein n=1 Tax=Tanacetum cinerariifolium TaxID=118510 RepID=A0A699VH53_TANCI|nr:hypothetical protein [Tanacetum cinerariifolium]